MSEEDLVALRGNVDHFFHLAAVYDMTADEARTCSSNVDGTRHAVELANAVEAGTSTTSSIAVAGMYKGLFREDDFDEGQKLPSAYHRTKFESERIVRYADHGAVARVPPGARRRQLQDRRDGQDRRPLLLLQGDPEGPAHLPEWFPLVGLELGWTNIVPVDYVAAAMDHIAHQPGLDGQAFHLTDPKAQRVGRGHQQFANAAHAPQLAMRIDKRMTDMLPKGVAALRDEAAGAQGRAQPCWPTSASPRRCSTTSG